MDGDIVANLSIFCSPFFADCLLKQDELLGSPRSARHKLETASEHAIIAARCRNHARQRRNQW